MTLGMFSIMKEPLLFRTKHTGSENGGDNLMKLLDQFISQTGKKPPDWTKRDIQKYLDYVRAHVTDATASKNMIAD